MISASELRELAANTKPTKAEIESIEKSLKREAGLGKDSAYFSQTITREMKKYLEGLGYSIESGMDRNESYTKISW